MTASPIRPKTCGALWATGQPELAAKNCKRLPRHHGDHTTDLPRGRMNKAQRVAAKLAVKAARIAAKPVKAARKPHVMTRTVKGIKYNLVAVVTVPAAPVTFVTVVPAARGKALRRRVGAPAKRSKTVVNRVSGMPRLSRPSVG